MFKKLKTKLAEEVAQSPRLQAGVQQLAQVCSLMFQILNKQGWGTLLVFSNKKLVCVILRNS